MYASSSQNLSYFILNIRGSLLPFLCFLALSLNWCFGVFLAGKAELKYLNTWYLLLAFLFFQEEVKSDPMKKSFVPWRALMIFSKLSLLPFRCSARRQIGERALRGRSEERGAKARDERREKKNN